MIRFFKALGRLSSVSGSKVMPKKTKFLDFRKDVAGISLINFGKFGHNFEKKPLKTIKKPLKTRIKPRIQ